MKQAEITSEDQVTKVTAHVTPKTGTGKTLYRVHWSRPLIETERVRDKDGRMITKEKKTYTNNETYKKLITFTDGKEEADKYKAKHPRAKFND